MKDMNKVEHAVVLSHPLCTTRLDVLCRLLFKEKNIKADAVPQFIAAFGMSTLMALPTVIESAITKSKIKNETVKSPLFIMGHWRSGTTLVQYILSKDKNFGNFDPVFNSAINYYNVLGWFFRPLVQGELSPTRPQDNMRFAMDLPLEEYMSYAKIEADGVYSVNCFPQSFTRYLDHTYWQDLPAKKAAVMKKKYDNMLRKCSVVNDHKRLLLKSPDNTGRIKVLHEMYPDAKFINIYRNPYTVIRSTLHMYDSVTDLWTMQKVPSKEQMEDWVIDNFKRMYENFFAYTATLSPDEYYEIRFEDFEKDPFPYLKEAYERLDLGNYEAAKAGFEEYWKAESNYKKNSFEYPEHLKKKIEDKLGFYFEHYGYEKGVIQ